jgi:mono/diheme cytochrome c family protein
MSAFSAVAAPTAANTGGLLFRLKLVGAGCLVVLSGGCGQAPPQTDGSSPLIARGSYIVNSVGACGNCHTPKDSSGRPDMARQFAGGGIWVTIPAFDVYAPNITPDVETGIGSWSDDDIKQAIRKGVRPAHGQLANVPLAPVMYSSYYKVLTNDDMDAVVAYLKSVPPIKNKVPLPLYKSPSPPVAPYPGAERSFTANDMRDPVKRGLYLTTISHCMECHSGRKGPVSDHVQALGKGGRVYTSDVVHGYPPELKEWVASDISSDPVKGIGAWSDAEIKAAITRGVSRDGHRLKAAMAFSFYAGMTTEDLDAIVAWLRTVPP